MRETDTATFHVAVTANWPAASEAPVVVGAARAMGAEAPGEVSGPAPADSEGVAMQEVVVVEDVAAEHASQSCAPGSDDAPSPEQEAPAGPKLVHAEPNGRASFIRGRPSVSAGSGAWRVTLRRLMLPIYMPAFMYGMSESIVIPVPIHILELHLVYPKATSICMPGAADLYSRARIDARRGGRARLDERSRRALLSRRRRNRRLKAPSDLGATSAQSLGAVRRVLLVQPQLDPSTAQPDLGAPLTGRARRLV